MSLLIFFFFLKIKGWITGLKELKCFSLQWSKDLRARKGPFEISVFLKTVGCDLGHGTQWVKNVFLKRGLLVGLFNKWDWVFNFAPQAPDNTKVHHRGKSRGLGVKGQVQG